jgi:hypothetical protein
MSLSCEVGDTALVLGKHLRSTDIVELNLPRLMRDARGDIGQWTKRHQAREACREVGRAPAIIDAWNMLIY